MADWWQIGQWSDWWHHGNDLAAANDLQAAQAAPETAVAAAQVVSDQQAAQAAPETAVAAVPKGPPTAKRFQVDALNGRLYMLTLDALMAQSQVPNHFSDHNAVLKYVRDHQEHEGQGTKELSLECEA